MRCQCYTVTVNLAVKLQYFSLYSVIVASPYITTSYFSVVIEITHTPVSSVNVMTTPAVVSTIKLLTPTQAHAPLGVGVYASTVNTIQLASFVRCVRRDSTGRVERVLTPEMCAHLADAMDLEYSLKSWIASRFVIILVGY